MDVIPPVNSIEFRLGLAFYTCRTPVEWEISLCSLLAKVGGLQELCSRLNLDLIFKIGAAFSFQLEGLRRLSPDQERDTPTRIQMSTPRADATKSSALQLIFSSALYAKETFTDMFSK